MSQHSLHAFPAFLPIYILMDKLVQVTHLAKQGIDLQLFILTASINFCRSVQGNWAQPWAGI